MSEETEAPSGLPCTNCGEPDAPLLSFDLDLPPLRHCTACAYAMLLAPRWYDQRAGRVHRRPCSVCGREIAVNGDGTTRVHGNGRRFERCPGMGKVPAART